MKKPSKFFLFALVLATCLSLPAQTPTWSWAYGNQHPITNESNLQATAFDTSGNIIFIGRNAGAPNLTLNGAPINPFSGALIIGKADTAGNVLWMRSQGGAGPTLNFHRVRVDTWNNIYVTGHFSGTLTFPGFSASGVDMYVAKFDPIGNFIWARTGMSSSFNDWPRDFEIDSLGNSFIVGEFGNTINFTDTSFSAQALYDGYIISLDSAGNYRWAQHLKGISGDRMWGVEVEKDGNILAIAQLFNVGGNIGGVYLPSGVHLVRFNSQTGAVIGNRKIATDCNPKELELFDDGNFIVTGDFGGPLTIGTTINFNGQGTGNIFVAKYDSAGNELWARASTSSASAIGWTHGCFIDGSGNVIVDGYIEVDQTFGSDSYTTGINQWDGFVVSWDQNGNQRWSLTAPSMGISRFDDLVADDLGRIYLPGSFYYGVTLDGNWSLANTLNAYCFLLTKLEVPAISFTTPSISLCNNSTFTVPLSNWTTFNPGNVFTAEISDASGSFASPDTLGQVTATGNVNILCTIPTLLPPGTGYRIRVTASDLAYISADNGVDITINANQLSLGSIPQIDFCQGETFTIPFTTTCPLNSGNIFTAQLSDAAGSFGSPTSIGTLSSINSGTINATIPLAQPAGIAYRIRITSSNTILTSAANGVDISIFLNPAQPVISDFGDSLVSTSALSYQWNFNGTPIGGATGQSHIAAQTGNYTVTIFDANGCSNTSAPVFVSVLANFGSIPDQSGISVFPNPAAETVFVNFQNLDGSVKLELVNLSGVVIKSWQNDILSNSATLELSLSGVSSGYYFLRLTHVSEIYNVGLAVR